MPDDRPQPDWPQPDWPQPDRPLADRLPLGKASRILGVDPDTLRRWADEGRVPAFTTPGGHRRFDRRALERLVDSRRTGPSGWLAGLGETPDRLTAAYRRRYGELHGRGSDARSRVPAGERATFRDEGRRLVDAMVRHLDGPGPERTRAEQRALAFAGGMGRRLAQLGVPLEDGVEMFVTARRPFLEELSVMARRRNVDAARVGQMYDVSTGLLDRLLLAFVAGHAGVDARAHAVAEPDGDPPVVARRSSSVAARSRPGEAAP